MADHTELKTTPLTEWHRRQGAKMVPFAGFEMPVQYAGVLAEHAAVREQVRVLNPAARFLVTSARSGEGLTMGVSPER